MARGKAGLEALKKVGKLDSRTFQLNFLSPSWVEVVCIAMSNTDCDNDIAGCAL